MKKNCGSDVTLMLTLVNAINYAKDSGEKLTEGGGKSEHADSYSGA